MGRIRAGRLRYAAALMACASIGIPGSVLATSGAPIIHDQSPSAATGVMGTVAPRSLSADTGISTHDSAAAATAPEIAAPPLAELPEDSATPGFTRLMLHFRDPGVPEEARGNTAAAVTALTEGAQAAWQHAAGDLPSLVPRAKVLNTFWITRAVLVSVPRDEQTLQALSQLPGLDRITPDFTVTPLDNDAATATSTPPDDAVTPGRDGQPVAYGLATIGADDAWADFDVDGAGIRVAVLDSGVDPDHPDIAGSLVGSNTHDPTYPGGWISFDAQGKPVSSRPADPGSHGTHVAGTIVGKNSSGTRIGVAPGAQLMVADVLSGASAGSYSKILAGLQWALRPHTGRSTDEHVGAPANVINMSLGVPGYDDAFTEVIRNIRAAGIFPAIAIGNKPCGPTGMSSPGSVYEAVAVGMTDADDAVNPDSCGAVASWPAPIRQKYHWPEHFTKPDLSAPGTRTYSSLPGGRWGISTGSSMATPHVAGAVALMMSAKAGLTVDQLQQALSSTAVLPGGGEPNTRYGHGRIDVHAAIAAVLSASGVSATITDAETHKPLPGVTVSYTDEKHPERTATEQWFSDDAGVVRAPLVPGTYEMTFSKFGYEPHTESVTVGENITVVQPQLKPQATGVITGMVKNSDGEAVAQATVAIVGQRNETTTDADGRFTLSDLPAGKYTVSVKADGYSSVEFAATVQAVHETSATVTLHPRLKVLVVGDSGRTVEMLQKAEIDAAATESLPAPGTIKQAGWDVVVVDTPTEIDPKHLTEFTQTPPAPMIWLDLNSETTAMAQLASAGLIEGRASGNDPELGTTGYQVVAEHPIFAHIEHQIGSVITMNGQEAGPKYWAAFTQIPQTRILAHTVTSDRDGAYADRGAGIAVRDSHNLRQVYLALHATAPSTDVRVWQAPARQLFINAITWAARSEERAGDPVVDNPRPLPAPPSPPAPAPNPWRPVTPAPPVPTVPTVPAVPGPAIPPPSPRPQAVPLPPAKPVAAATKPTLAMPAPAADIAGLQALGAAKVTITVADGIAQAALPGAKPGDWLYVHFFPGAIDIDWVQVDDEGLISLDVSQLGDGEYALALTAVDGSFGGWGQFTIGTPAPTPTPTEPASAPSATPVAAAVPPPAAGLSTSELIMVGAAGGLFFVTALVLAAAARRRSVGVTQS